MSLGPDAFKLIEAEFTIPVLARKGYLEAFDEFAKRRIRDGSRYKTCARAIHKYQERAGGPVVCRAHQLRYDKKSASIAVIDKRLHSYSDVSGWEFAVCT